MKFGQDLGKVGGFRSRKRDLYATGLLNCPKSSSNARIITVEYTVESKVGMYFETGRCEKISKPKHMVAVYLRRSS